MRRTFMEIMEEVWREGNSIEKLKLEKHKLLIQSYCVGCMEILEKELNEEKKECVCGLNKVWDNPEDEHWNDE